jgi:hypothetical protein
MAITDEQRKIAILTAALGVCRGMLYSVRIDDYKQEEIEATLDAISPSNLAEVFGIPEAEFQIDCREHLTTEEIDKLMIVAKP